MTINEAIKKAIEGGYIPELWIGIALDNNEIPEPATYALDPQFWQCLGKAMGLGGYDWLAQWHSFIDHLASGKTVEDFFKDLK